MKEPGRGDIIRKGSSIIAARPTNDVVMEAIDNSLFNYLILRAYDELEPGRVSVHRIPVKEVMEYLNVDRIGRLHSSLERLGQGALAIDYLDGDGQPRTMNVHYLSSDVSKTGEGMLVFAFDPILVHFLYEPKVFAVISVNRVRDLKTVASQKLYEMMSLQFRKKSPVWRTNVEELRAQLQVGDKYGRFDNFRKHVIEKSVEDVNAIADFDVLVEYVKGGKGGGVVEIVFKAVSKTHSRLIEAASVKSTKARRRQVDPHTIDLLDGKTFVERGGPAELSAEAIEKARDLMPDGADINQLVGEWREANRGRSLSEPDRHFLSWIELRLAQETDPLLKDLDGDVFGSLLGGRD